MADLSCVDFLPSKYINEVIENSETTAVIRSNISSLSDINSWIDEFGFLSETQWNARSSKPSAEKFVCLKKFVCHHSAFKKIDSDKNKKGISKNFGCSATITAKIKLNTLATRKKDPYVKKGLVGVITINKVHNHSLQTGDTLRFLPADQHIKIKFFEYFNNGMGIAEACRHHEGLLEKTGDSSEGVLASGRINPSKRTVRYWHDQWLENSEQQMDDSLSEQETEASRSESDEGTDEAEFVKNGSSMDDADCDEEHEEPLHIVAIKEEVIEEETGYIHDDHANKDASFASVWIKEEVDKEAELENEDEEEAIEEEYMNESDEITDEEAELVKNESTVDEADCDEENEQFLNMVIKEEVISVEETGYIHNEHTEKDASFTSVWIKEEVDNEEPELENVVEEEDIEEQYMNESVLLSAVTTVVKEEVTVHDAQSSQYKLGLEHPETSTFFQDTASPQTILNQKSVQKNVDHSELDMQNKVSKSQSKVRKYECDMCDKVYKSHEVLRQHKYVHSGIRNYECNTCNKNFSSSSNLASHKFVHSNIKKHKCHTCDKSFKTFCALRVHKLIHSTDKKYKCDICEKAFKLPSTLSQHKSTHSEAKRYQCSVCNKTFPYLHLLSRHDVIHNGIKKYHCEICNKAFHRKCEVLRHKSVHSTGIKKYQCDICNKSFNWSTSLSAHKLLHTGIKFHCDICNKNFSNSSNLGRHRIWQH